MFDGIKDMMNDLYTCSKHNYTGMNQPCPDCAGYVQEIASLKKEIERLNDELHAAWNKLEAMKK